MGPMIAAGSFLQSVSKYFKLQGTRKGTSMRCILKGSLAFTGKGHNTHYAVALGLHGYRPESLAALNMDDLITRIWNEQTITVNDNTVIAFTPDQHIVFDQTESLPQHPNGMIFELLDLTGEVLLSETYFSIGGGFISTLAEINQLVAPLKMESAATCPYAFDSARSMLQMSIDSGLSISGMKRVNELEFLSEQALDHGLDEIWRSMQSCVEQGLAVEGVLPGGLDLPRRARTLYLQLQDHPEDANLNDWLCAYAMAVNEENAAGHMVVTAPTNGAAGVIPAVLYYIVHHEQAGIEQVREFLLTASAIGGIIKHRSSISGAEVGCQGEVGSAASMAAAGLCAVRGGTAEEIENAAEIALEHHLGMTCDPVNGLVQVPCIERNGFGAIKAYTAASLAIKGGGRHFMPLDNCIAAMKQTGKEMSAKFKETSLGGLAVSLTEC
jgi:L-serine dehydratase